MEGLRHSIAVRLLAIVFGFYLVLTLTLTAIHMHAEYSHARERVFDELNIIQETFAPGLAAALWNMNHEQLKPTFLGMVDFPTIVGAKILNEDDEPMGMTGRIPDGSGANLYQHQAPIIYDHRGQPVTVGTAILYSSPAVVFDKVKLSLYFIFANAVIKTLAFWVIFLLVARTLLIRPLRSLITATRNLDPDHPRAMHFDPGIRGKNELSELAEAFDGLTLRVASTREAREDGARIERRRIMRDLHDDVGGHLLSLIHHAGDPWQESTARKAFNALRESINALDEDREFTLGEVLDNWRIDAESRLSPGRTTLVIEGADGDGGETRLSPRQAINLRRVLDEALTNAIKHGSPDRLQVTVSCRHGQLHLSVMNDGLAQGSASAADAALSQGRGLPNMRTRLAELGGRIDSGIRLVDDSSCYCVDLSFPINDCGSNSLLSAGTASATP